VLARPRKEVWAVGQLDRSMLRREDHPWMVWVCSVIVKPYSRTNIRSHGCQGHDRSTRKCLAFDPLGDVGSQAMPNPPAVVM
jgi:hypothetical protein